MREAKPSGKRGKSKGNNGTPVFTRRLCTCSQAGRSVSERGEGKGLCQEKGTLLARVQGDRHFSNPPSECKSLQTFWKGT